MSKPLPTSSHYIYVFLLFTSFLLILFAILAEPNPLTLLQGFFSIQFSETGNITDSFVTGGMGGAFLNAGVILLLSILGIRFYRLPFTGQAIACLYMMAGFSLMGKNLFNTLPIVLGGMLYAKYKGEPFSKYIYITFFGTCLSPMVSFVMLKAHPSVSLLAMALCGLLIGFLIPAVSSYTVRIHQGYNLYNVGFAAGFLGLAGASLLKGFGVVFTDSSTWSQKNGMLPHMFIWVVVIALLAAGIYNGCRQPDQYLHLWRHSGRAVADFVLHDGLGTTFVNMALTGSIGILYTYIIRVDLNGPLLCCILSLMGFGAFGKHPKNVLPVAIGAITSSLLMQKVPLTAPGVLLATYLCTGLAPISGQFGSPWGFLAGFIHMAIVQNTSFLHGGMNLYNNGFAAGLVCIITIPIIELFKSDSEE